MKKRCTASGSLDAIGGAASSTGLPLQELGQDVGAAAHREKGLVGDPRGLDRDVDRGVADPKHQNPLALQHIGLAVVMHVHLLAGELLRAGKGRFGPARVPVVAVGNEHGSVANGLPLPIGIRNRDLPLPVSRLDAHNFGPKPNLVRQPEVLDVVVEISSNLEVARVIGVVIGHRKRLERHQLPRAVDVQRAIRGGLPVVVFVAPVTSNLGALLEAVERDPASAEHLAGGYSGRAGSDHTNFLGGHHLGNLSEWGGGWLVSQRGLVGEGRVPSGGDRPPPMGASRSLRRRAPGPPAPRLGLRTTTPAGGELGTLGP